jgi:hypothetical protein
MSKDTFPYRKLDLGVTGQVVRATPCILDNYFISNVAATARFVKIYDKATAAAETDTPVKTICIPATASANVAGLGWKFMNGCSVRCTNLVADNDTTAPTANDVVVNLGMG